MDNKSPETVMMAPHSNVYDDTPKTNGILDGEIPTNATKEASAEIRDLYNVAKYGGQSTVETQSLCLC